MTPLTPAPGLVARPGLDPRLASAIGAEVRAFVTAAGPRRALTTTCHVGHPGREHVRLEHAEVTGQCLRADLVERAVDGLLDARGACAWVTRGGELSLADADAEWFAAARTAFARHGIALPAFFVLNRRGWVDLLSGQRREWARVRATPPSTSGPPASGPPASGSR